MNTIYGRWWHPLDEKPGPNPVPGSPLPWTGDFHDGLGNKISMLAYANPPDIADEKQRADGYGIARFDKKKRTITFECWPRFADAKQGDKAQFPGWPITVAMDANDGRKVHARLPAVNSKACRIRSCKSSSKPPAKSSTPCVRRRRRFVPRVYAPGNYTVKAGQDKPDTVVAKGLKVS